MPKPRWDEFCAVCGGPPRSDKFLCTAGLNLTANISTDWLDDWVGVTPEQPDQPSNIGTYNDHGCFEQPHNDPEGRNWPHMPLQFATLHEWMKGIDPWEREHDRRHGPAGQCDCEPPDEDEEDSDCQYDDRTPLQACRVLPQPQTLGARGPACTVWRTGGVVPVTGSIMVWPSTAPVGRSCSSCWAMLSASMTSGLCCGNRKA